MLIYTSLFFLLLSAVNAVKTYEASDLDKAKMEEYYLCLETLLCYEKKIDEFWKLGETVKGKECEGHFKDALIKGYDTTPELTFEYWDELGKRICVENREQWVDRFKNFGTSMGGSFQENDCESQKEHPMCQCFFGLLEEGEAVIKNYTDIGVCGNPEKEFKKFKTLG